jgi:uncharacterized protein (UPF0332 family)
VSERQALLDKAERFIRSATLLIRDGDLDSAASRLYYAMFYTAEVVLDAKGLAFSSHRAVISGFGEQFAKTGELDPKFHRVLITAFEKRQLSDYVAVSGLAKSDVEELQSQARTFLDAARGWLKQRTG